MVGEYQRFHATLMSQADSLLFSTKTGEGDPQLIQVDTNATRLTEITIVLQQMREGEIAKIMMPLSQFGVKPPGLEKDSVLFYEVEYMAFFFKLFSQ